jgi:hypothetical protein
LCDVDQGYDCAVTIFGGDKTVLEGKTFLRLNAGYLPIDIH